MKKKINLALQGGGAHGAFTWGVLDTLLDDGRLEITAVSGTSAGAMNAVMLADGVIEGGADGARRQLEIFWRRASLDGQMNPAQRNLFNLFLGAMDPFNLASGWMEQASNLVSPYQFNPLDINPLRDLVEELIDFKRLRENDKFKLFIGATNVQTGKIRVFRRPELTADMVMASACLPTLFRAVEIEGAPYWDGGYSGNPPLFPLFSETSCPDVLLIQINPIFRSQTPTSPSDIMNRLNEITFNAPLLGEFRAIEFVGRLIDQGSLSPTHYKKANMHLIAGGDALAQFPASTKTRADFSFMKQMFAIGQHAGKRFLEENFDAIGERSTFNLRDELESHAP